MKPRIENPKVFISYAWGDKDYQEKVLAFASDLMSDHVDVVLDQWSLKEGYDTYSFMEQSVTDSNITNVLILLDPNYENKSNSRKGGVGTETQIISPEIYNKVNQEKFLPVVFARRENGEIPKPQFLKGLLHFDLTQDENYDNEYRRLVKRLYGIDQVAKPPIGKKPEWLEKEENISNKTIISFQCLSKDISEINKTAKFNIFLETIKNKIISFNKDRKIISLSDEEYINLYDETQYIRDEFLELIKYTSYIPESYKLISDFLERIYNDIYENNNIIIDIIETFIHELFIYIIAIYLKNNDVNALSYILNKTYFAPNRASFKHDNFHIFYKYNQQFDSAVCNLSCTQYVSGTAHHWINNINIKACNKKDFIYADLFCYNINLLTNKSDLNNWFPITYIYGTMYHSIFNFAITLTSKEHLSNIAKIAGYMSEDDFIIKFKEIEEKYNKGIIQKLRYPNKFDEAPIIFDYIKSDKLGIVN